MLDALVSAAVFALVVALVLAVLYVLTVGPFLLALRMAEERGFSTGRWGGLAVVGVLLALAFAFLVRHAGAPRLVQPLPLLLVLAAPAALWLLEPGQPAGGRAGRHESPL